MDIKGRLCNRKNKEDLKKKKNQRRKKQWDDYLDKGPKGPFIGNKSNYLDFYQFIKIYNKKSNDQ